LRDTTLRNWLSSSLLAAGISLALGTACAQTQSFPTLLRGTPVMLQLDQTIDGSNSRMGQRVSFVVSGDVKIGEHVVIPAGSSALGTVVQASRRGWFEGTGRVSVNIDAVRLPSGQVVPLCTTPDLEDNGGGTVDDAIATSLQPPPVGGHLLLHRAKPAVIPEGTVVVAFIRRDTAIVQQTASVSN
jgi:hypothetical protein